jgi:hypothetical protein
VVVVAKDGPQAVRRGELAQEAGARLGRECASAVMAAPGNRNKIAGEHDEIGTETIHDGDGGVQRVDGEVRIVMEIADEGDGEASEAFRPTGQKEILANDVGVVGLEQDSIRGESDSGDGGSPAEKLASCRERGQKLKEA